MGCAGGRVGGGPDPEQLLRQVPALVDAPVHGHKALQARLVPDVGIVKAGVQHDHSKGQHVAGVCSSRGVRTQVSGPTGSCPRPSPSPAGPGVRAPTCGLENPGVTQAVSLGKGFHHPVNLLGLSREAEAPQKLPAWKGAGALSGPVEPLSRAQSRQTCGLSSCFAYGHMIQSDHGTLGGFKESALSPKFANEAWRPAEASVIM